MSEIDHLSKTIADQVTVIGALEHIYFHAKKSAGVVEDEDEEIFFQTVAQMAKDFRRSYMKAHFPDCTDTLWCLGKATEEARQRVYESDEGTTEDIRAIDALWNKVWSRIAGRDLSGCSVCRDDKNSV